MTRRWSTAGCRARHCNVRASGGKAKPKIAAGGRVWRGDTVLNSVARFRATHARPPQFPLPPLARSSKRKLCLAEGLLGLNLFFLCPAALAPQGGGADGLRACNARYWRQRQRTWPGNWAKVTVE